MSSVLSGYKTLRLRQPLSCMSPSTASTTSLAQVSAHNYIF